MRTSALTRTFTIIGTHIVALAAILLLGSGARAQSVFINELHYDNRGNDTNESVEVAGPAKTDLKNWKLVFYNGKSGKPYRTVALEGSLPDLQNGHGTLSFTVKGIQNGAPDGVALVNPDNEVIHFISYEGRFTASAGVAKGLVAQDIGFQESDRSMPDRSIQLKGTGKTLEDFHWAEPAQATPDKVNVEQAFGAKAGDDAPEMATRVK